MDSYKYTPIDPSKLEIQLLRAIEEDSKYKIEDAAKFRAVEQSKNYEEFRDIVKAAHLKPLEKHDSLQNSKIDLVCWNRTAKRACWRSETDRSLSATRDNFEYPTEDVLNAPIVQRNFEQHWESSNCLEKRVTILQRVIGTENFFEGRELSIVIIENLIKTLLELLDPKSMLLPSETKVEFVMKVMTSISSSSRFSLTLQFLSKEGWNNMRDLLNTITESVEKKTDLANSKEMVKDLTNKYSIWKLNE